MQPVESFFQFVNWLNQYGDSVVCAANCDLLKKCGVGI